MMKFINKKLVGIIISSLLLSCTNISNIDNQALIKEKKSFGIKSIPTTVENTDLTYTGSWSESGNIHQSTGTVNNNSSSLVYSGNWLTVNNGSTTEGNYAYTNSGNNTQVANDTSDSITYTRNGWLTYSAFTYNDIYTSSKYILTNQEIDINKIKYIYNGAYNVAPNSVSPKEESWSASTMHLAWKTSISSDGLSYTESKESTSKIEIPFTGTNIQVYQYKNSNMGNCSIKVLDSNNNELRSLTVNNNNATWLLAKTTITGLPNGNNKLVIQGINGHRFNFVRAEVMPSIEYKFTGNNINYNAFTGNNCGRVAVTIDNDSATTQIIDLYDSRNIYQNIFTKTGLGSGQHTITIDGLQEKNPSSSGFRININEFNVKPSVRGQFNGTFFNLKLVGTPDSGKADLYIDEVWNREVDMYNSSSSFYSINVSGLTNTSHTFELVAKNDKNPLSSGTRVNFDGYTTNKGSYTFIGTGIKYFANKNNNQGLVDVWVDGTKYGTYNLYSNSLQESQEIVNITGLIFGEHTIDFIPSGIKSWNSSNYFINIDYLETKVPKKTVWYGYDGNTYHIYTKNNDGTGNINKISDLTNNNFYPKINIDATKVVWHGNESTYHIYIRNSDGSGNITQLSDTSTNNNLYPQISKNGNKVVWYGNNLTTEHIYIRNADGSGNITQLSDTSTSNFNPQISQDSTKVVWSGTLNSVSHIFIRNSDGSNSPIQLSTTSTNNSNPQISSDGTKVVWRGTISGNTHIFSRNSDGSGNVVQLSDNSTNNQGPQISSDGTKVVWFGISSGSYHIFIRNSDGSNSPLQLSTTSTTNQEPQISSDGTKVVWFGVGASAYHIFIRNADGSNSPLQLSTTSTDNQSPQISTDNSRVTWSGKTDGIFHIYVRDSLALDNVIQLSSTTSINQFPQISD